MNLSSVVALFVLSALASIVICSDANYNYTGEDTTTNNGGVQVRSGANHEMTKKLRRYKVLIMTSF